MNTLINDQVNGKVEKNDRCCGESGTFAVTRPDVATQVRFRKEIEMKKGAEKATRRRLQGRGEDSHVVPVVHAGPEALQR